MSERMSCTNRLIMIERVNVIKKRKIEKKEKKEQYK